MSDRNYLDCHDDYLSCGDDYLSCVDETPVVIKPDPVVVPPVEPHKPRKDDDFVYELFFKGLIIVHFFIDKVKRFFKRR